MNEVTRISWCGPVLSSFSIAEASRNYLLSLHDLGCNLSVEQTIEMQNRGWLSPELEKFFKKLIRTRVKKPYYHVNYSVTPAFKVEPDAAANVGYMPVDYSELIPEWTTGWEGQDELWVPCLYNVAGMIRAGFNPGKVWRLPHGVEVERFRPGLEPLEELQPGPFRFLAVSQYLFRKGWDTLFRAYIQEFSPKEEVELVVKSGHRAVLEKLCNEIRIGDRTPAIRFIDRPMRVDEMPRLYCSADAFVLSPRVEAWCLPFTEAMAAGLPDAAKRAA